MHDDGTFEEIEDIRSVGVSITQTQRPLLKQLQTL